jgi:hypothetical protein
VTCKTEHTSVINNCFAGLASVSIEINVKAASSIFPPLSTVCCKIVGQMPLPPPEKNMAEPTELQLQTIFLLLPP